MTDCSPEIITFSRPLTGVRLRGDAAAEARREAELSEAYQRGYDAAAEEVRAARDAERAELVAFRDQTLQRLAECGQRLGEKAEAALPGLILEGVRRVLPEVEIDGALIGKVIREILDERVPDGTTLLVLLSPQDCELMEKLCAESPSSYPNIEFKSDAALQRGDCLVQSRFGTTDARIETKLRNLGEALS